MSDKFDLPALTGEFVMFAKLKQKTLEDKPKSQPSKEPQEQQEEPSVGFWEV